MIDFVINVLRNYRVYFKLYGVLVRWDHLKYPKRRLSTGLGFCRNCTASMSGVYTKAKNTSKSLV